MELCELVRHWESFSLVDSMSHSSHMVVSCRPHLQRVGTRQIDGVESILGWRFDMEVIGFLALIAYKENTITTLFQPRSQM